MELTKAHPESFAVLAATLDGLTDDELTRSTPCAGWTLADLLAHLVAQQQGFAAAADGRSDAAEWAVPPAGTSAALVMVAVRSTAFSSVGRLAGALATGRQLTLAEYSRTVPAEVAAGMQVVDNLAHAWDLSRARDRPLVVDPDLVDIALRLAERIPADPTGRGPGYAFGPALPTDGLPPLHRFLALLGRDPAWSRPANATTKNRGPAS